MSGGARTFKDVTKALQSCFTSPKVPLSLPSDARRMLQGFVGEHAEKIESEDGSRANAELKTFWDKYASDNAQKVGAFVGVLRELHPAITGDDNVLAWYKLVVRKVIGEVGFKKAAVEDAQEFLTAIMVYEEDDEDVAERARLSKRICTDLLDIYISRTRGLAEDEQLVAPSNAHIAQQVESVLIAFGRKMPKQLFHAIDDLLTPANTRLQGLTLLSSFLRQQTPHLYLVLNTPLVDHLLKCLMNDTSTTVLSVALTSLIMLLPHIPGSMGSRLPRLFLIYSRLLCWEKFSPLSTDAQKNLVTDDRVPAGADSDDERDDVGIDPSWEKARPKEGLIEANTPEIMTYFTYLYGLFPLNLMSYIRKPRKFLKNVDFPGADDFDLDQAVIRSRSDQFRQAHLLHPNFYNSTVEEELSDPKWPKMDPADVVAECHSLCINNRPVLLSPGPPPTGRLPDLPPLPPLPPMSHGSLSQSASHTSLRSGNSWRDTQSTAVSTTMADADSPLLRPQSGQSDDEFGEPLRPRSKGTVPIPRSVNSTDELPLPLSNPPFEREKLTPPHTNLAYLQREITLLRNDLNFERWHKAQYSQHIGQLMRRNVKDATVEAETLNLINANRALKQQVEQVRGAREATLRDSVLTRKQANNLEANMTERLNKMKKEQETWSADADELRRLRTETKQLRDLLSAAEARELNKSHKLEIMKQDLERLSKLQTQLHEAQRRLREYEYREFDFEQAKREQEILQSQRDTLQMRLQRQEQERERIRHVYAERITELEAQIGSNSNSSSSGGGNGIGPGSLERTPSSPPDATHTVTQQTLIETQARLNQLKKAHGRLLEKYTELDIEYQSVRSQLDTLLALSGTRELDGDFIRDSSSSIYHLHRGSASVGGGGPGSIASGGAGGGAMMASGALGVIESVYDVASEYGSVAPSVLSTSEPPYSAHSGAGGAGGVISRSDPSSRRYQHQALPVSPPGSSGATINSAAGLTWGAGASGTSVSASAGRPERGARGRNATVGSSSGGSGSGSSGTTAAGAGAGPAGSSSQGPMHPRQNSGTFNPTAPLGPDEQSVYASSLEQRKKEKITPDSQMRVYGRGGAQNIKMKPKDKEKPEKPKSSGFKGFKF